MGGANDHNLLRFRLDPTLRAPPARKNQRMHFVALNDRKLQIAIKRRYWDFFPHTINISAAFVVALIHIINAAGQEITVRFHNSIELTGGQSLDQNQRRRAVLI